MDAPPAAGERRGGIETWRIETWRMDRWRIDRWRIEMEDRDGG